MSIKTHNTLDLSFQKGYNQYVHNKRKQKMILIINKSKKNARALSDMLYYIGILSYGSTPEEALSEVSPIYRAIIIENPDLLADKKDYVSRLRSYANIPIFSICDFPDSDDDLLFEATIKSGSYAYQIFKVINKYCNNNSYHSPGVYRLAGIEATINRRLPKFLYRLLPFTKTETMILRALIRLYPIPINSKSLLKYAFRQARTPDVSSVRTHISIMNKKFREISGRNLIYFSEDKGYKLLTPEVLDEMHGIE